MVKMSNKKKLEKIDEWIEKVENAEQFLGADYSVFFYEVRRIVRG